MMNKDYFLERFYTYVSEKGGCLHPRALSPLDAKLGDLKIFWEEQKNDDLSLIRSLILRYCEDDILETLNGCGEAYMGGDDDIMAPYGYETLNVNIPSNNADLGQVWKLYSEWLMKWTPAKELRILIGEPIREEKPRN